MTEFLPTTETPKHQVKIKITFQEEVLSTKPAQKDLFKGFILSKSPKKELADEEVDSTPDLEEVGTCIFSCLDGKPGIFNYQLKGFFKDACGALNRCDKEEREGLDKLTAYKTKIDGCIFVQPRFIPFEIPEHPELSLDTLPGLQTDTYTSPPGVNICGRPIRLETPKGPRTAIVRSESVPKGTIIRVEIKILAKELKPYVVLWLNYAAWRGMGQWRNSDKGIFTWEEIP